MTAFIRDCDKIPRERIIEEPGRLPAQIINNIMIDKQYFIWVIGNEAGHQLYTVGFNNSTRAIIGCTDFDLLNSYVNRSEVKKSLLGNFGKTVMAVNLSFVNLQRTLGIGNEPQPMGNMFPIGNISVPRTVIVNPNSRDFYIPFDINYISYLQTENIEQIEKDIYEVDVVKLVFNNETKKYEKVELEEQYD